MGKAKRRAVALFRISVDKHKKEKKKREKLTYIPHGLGIEAQEAEVKIFEKQFHYTSEKTFYELISGRKKLRPILDEVQEYCRKNKCILIVAKLDRLTRRVAFIALLMESKIEFRIVEYGDIDPREIKGRVYWDAVQAELEVDTIRKRTKAALKAKLARGEKMGQFGKKILSKRNHRNSIKFALKEKRLFARIRKETGITSDNGLAVELNRLGEPTYRNDGSQWSGKTVHTIESIIKSERKKKRRKHY